MMSGNLPPANTQRPRLFAPRDPFEDHATWRPRRKNHPRCEAPNCGHRAHFTVRLESGEDQDVCSAHYIEVTTAIRDADF